jgi:hypothetical protein
MHVAKGPRQHVPPADHVICPPPLLVPPLPSLSLSLTPFSPSSLPQVCGCYHILCLTRPLVWAFRHCRPSSSFRCLVDIARCRRRAEPACGRRRAGLAVGRGRAGPAQLPCCCWACQRLPTRVVNGGPRKLIPKLPAQITVLSSPK